LLASAYGADLPELGAVTATCRLAGNCDQFRVEQIQVETLTSEDLKTNWAGTISFDRKKYDLGLRSVSIKLLQNRLISDTASNVCADSLTYSPQTQV
jgi:hypothetical protein